MDFLKSYQDRNVTIKESNLTARLIDLTGLDKNTDAGSVQVAKFILIKKDDEVCLVIGLLGKFPYHAVLLESYCSQENILTGTWEEKPDLYVVNDDDFSLTGGGWLEINSKDKKLKFFGVSKAYGPFDRSNLVHVLSNHTYFSSYSITIV